MKTISTIIIFLTVFTFNSNAQETQSSEKYGNTLNIGLGVAYYGYVGHSLPVVIVNYELDVAKNFTLAPFLGMYSYRNYYYWGNPSKPHWDESYRQYSYRVTVIPIGVKGTYYFDKLLKANAKWDFYGAGSLGFVYRSVVWDNAYYGDRNEYQSASPLFLDVHIGTEYHINSKTGLFFDLSTGISTLGLAFHL